MYPKQNKTKQNHVNILWDKINVSHICGNCDSADLTWVFMMWNNDNNYPDTIKCISMIAHHCDEKSSKQVVQPWCHYIHITGGYDHMYGWYKPIKLTHWPSGDAILNIRLDDINFILCQLMADTQAIHWTNVD